MYREQAEEFKRRQAELMMMEATQEVPEEDTECRPPGSNLVPVPVEEIEARIPWCTDFPPMGRADAACGTDYSYAQGSGAVPAAPGWPLAMAEQPAPASSGTVIWVPYGTQVDSASNVLLPAQPAPGHQFVVMQVPAQGMHGPGAGGEGMVHPYAVPAPAAFPHGPDGEGSPYVAAGGPVWMGPSADVAYAQPTASDQAPPIFWIPSAPPFEHAGIVAFAEQPAPEEQAVVQLFEETGAYAEEEAPRDAPPASGAFAAEGLGEHTFAEPEVSTPAGPPPEVTAKGGQSTVPPEPASGDQHVPPLQPAATTAAQPAKRTSEVPAVARRAEDDAVAAFLQGEWAKVERAGQGNYYDPAKARTDRRAV